MAIPADLAGNLTTPAPVVRSATPDDAMWLHGVLDRCWGGATMVVRGKPVDVTALPIRVYGRREGFVAFRFDPEPELVLLQSLQRRAGVATALLQDVIALVRQRGGSSLIAMTTNDNLAALAFYRKNGFAVRRVWRGAVDRARRIKPSIPKANADGVAISDEIELALRW